MTHKIAFSEKQIELINMLNQNNINNIGIAKELAEVYCGANEIEKLEKMNIIYSEKIGNDVFYHLNRENEYTKKILKYYRDGNEQRQRSIS
ncbi:MAG: hypothetical protein J7K26_02610 [Candidatus Aenigmarchaeota archaeon]|nr:hypothetical protein [Candidatus Aenigmarchaeota archaeon]